MGTSQFYAASDTRDATLWVDTFFTDDAAITFGNHPTVRGKGNIRPVSLLPLFPLTVSDSELTQSTHNRVIYLTRSVGGQRVPIHIADQTRHPRFS